MPTPAQCFRVRSGTLDGARIQYDYGNIRLLISQIRAGILTVVIGLSERALALDPQSRHRPDWRRCACHSSSAQSLTQNSRWLQSSAAKDRFRNPQPPLSLGGENWSSCPFRPFAGGTSRPPPEGVQQLLCRPHRTKPACLATADFLMMGGIHSIMCFRLVQVICLSRNGERYGR